MRALVADLSEHMLSIDPQLETWPAVNKTISRIHRDIRFSKDKTLYRDSMWITFKRPSAQWRDEPGFFFELRPQSYRYGMGFYAAGKETMDKLRAWIDEEPEQFRRTIAFYERQQTFVIEGECYKRLPGGPKSEPFQEWYRRKTFIWFATGESTSCCFPRGLRAKWRRDSPCFPDCITPSGN